KAEIIQLLNSEPLVSHPDNACISLYEILNIPNDDDHHILVMPFLRELESPPFETLGEVMEFCRQALYGLRFLHRHNIAHGDPHSGNIMLDPTTMYPDGFYTGFPPYADLKSDFSGRARSFTRTQRPSRYYWIDYNLAHILEHPEKPGTLRIPYTRGGDRDIPETTEGKTHADPFASDVWWVGNVIQELIDRYSGRSLLSPLVEYMCQKIPEDRPAMAAATDCFDRILAQCSSWRLRRLTLRRKHQFGRFLQAFPRYIARTVHYLVIAKPALPRPDRMS
ncbi:hypothetical protein DFH07DRAFT_750565, partial [Mycena maculata]